MPSTQNHKKPLTIAIMGASGFIGRHLITYLLEETDYQIRALCRHPESIDVKPQYKHRVSCIPTDVFDHDQIEIGLHGADVAVYLVHMMYRRGNYYKHEATAAAVFGKAVRLAKIERVVYMSGLGSDSDNLSRHLRSRHHSGDVLRKYVQNVIELRSSMVVGDGSAAYEIMKRLVKNLPVQTMPAWAVTPTQPITLLNAVEYLAQSLTVQTAKHEIVEIGGPEQLTYKDLIARYAYSIGKKPVLLVIPIVPVKLSGWWLNLFTPPNHAKIGRQMAESLRNPMIVTNNRAEQLFPHIKPEPIEKAFTV